MAKRRTLIGVAVAAAVVLVGLGVTYALGQTTETPQACHHKPLARLIRGQIAPAIALHDELDVTDEQKAELHGILVGRKVEMKPLVGELVRRKRALYHAVIAEQPDEAAIRREAAGLGDAVGDLAVAMAGVAGEARQVLTPEQVTLLKDALAERQGAVDRWLDEMDG